MKKILSVLLCAVMLLSVIPPVSASQQNPDSYYSEKNAPVLYGASEITIPVGTVFDPLDARFRVLASDFEDNDLTQSIEVTGSVDGDTAGDYALYYSVTDSHGNESILTVPVHVVDGTDKITVKRILYTIPSTWNTDLCGFFRGTRSDRQILGIFLPAGQSVELRTVDADADMKLSFFANDSKKESSVTVKNDGAWVSVKNTNTGVDYASVPLLSTLIMDKGVAVGKTNTVELRYDASVPALNYYHVGDDEQLFRDKWNAEQNAFGILDCSAMMLVVPYDDLQYSVGYYKNGTGFDSLDEFLGYFIAFVAKMDEYVGLELDPADPLDQNVRTRYTVKANASGGGAAYYGTDHVGIHSASVKAIFSYGWGTLHEFAHGYQGSFGKAPDGFLSEVSNNILGHYIQIDKSIYKAPDDWLGSYAQIEDMFNGDRLKDNQDTYLKKRLYLICQMLDVFEGPQTYAKLFSSFRAETAAGKAPTTFDIYAETIALEYGVNVIPYLEAWGIETSDAAKEAVTQMQLPALSILGDTVDEKTRSEIMAGEGIKEKYALVPNSLFAEYGVVGSLVVETKSVDPSAVEGRTALLKDGKNTSYSAVVTGGKLTFENIPVGTYTLYMPQLNGFSCPNSYVTVTQSGSSVTSEYAKIKPIADTQKLCVQGINGTYGFTMAFDADYRSAVITLSGADMRSSHPYVKIYDDKGQLVAEENSEKFGGRYFEYNKTGGTTAAYTLAVAPGYVIEAYHDSVKAKVFVLSGTTGEKLTALNAPDNGVVKYVVTEYGLRLSTQTDADAEEIAYAALKKQVEKTIGDYMAEAQKDEIENKYRNMNAKNAVFTAYESLREADRAPYTAFIEALNRGGSPVVYAEAEISVPFGIKLNPYTRIKIYDNEDGEIKPDPDSVKIVTWADTGKLGKQKIEYTVFDSDGNTADYTLIVNVYEAAHSPMPLPGYAPTCTAKGLTEGSVCLICGEVLTPQKEIPMTEHKDVNNDGRCDSCGKDLGSGSGGFSFGSLWQRIIAFFRSIFSFLPFC